MFNKEKPNNTIVKIFFVVAACLMLIACYKHYYFPVEIEESEVSPAYQLEIRNDTTQMLTFLPRDGANKNVKEKQIPIGMSFITLLQIKKITVIENSTKKGELLQGKSLPALISIAAAWDQTRHT